MFSSAPLPALAACLLLAASTQAYVGRWHSFTDKSRVTSLVEHGGFVYAGTRGGIRRVDPGTLAQREFDNLDGLIDPWITGMARDSSGSLWAVALDGYVYSLARGGNRWEIHGRSYAAKQWKMNDRAVLAADSSLYLGSRKGLAVFDTRKKVSDLTLTRFGNDMDVPVLSLLRRGDSLYVGTPAGVYKARVYFASPLNPDPDSGYANIADPNQWIKVDLPPEPGRKYDHLAFIGDSLATYGPGTLLQSPVTVWAFAGRPLEIGGQPYPAEWDDYVAAVVSGGNVFAGGDAGLLASNAAFGGSRDSLLPALRAFPRDTVANIGANGGHVWGHAPSGLYELSGSVGGDFLRRNSAVLVLPPGYPDPSELYTNSLRNVVVDAGGDVYVGSWGGGLVVRLRSGPSGAWRNSAADPASCIPPFIPDNGFTVISALSKPRDGGLFAAIYQGGAGGNHQIVHLDILNGAISCPTGGEGIPGADPHAVHVFSDTLMGVATDRGVNFLILRGGVPPIESATLWTLDGSANEAWDLAADEWGRPWSLIGDRLAYLDSLGLSPARKLKPVDNFIGNDCRSLESDPSGRLWVGCGNGLFHVRTDPGGGLVSARRYGPDDGLPSLLIYDVSVDPSSGKVWVATDRGVAMLESASQPALPRGSLPVIIPYPNPFRPQHAFVVFGGLPPNSTLRIHDASGHVVRILRPRDLKGNEFQWDGRNENGRPVAPGVYLFAVTSGSATQRGKVIVAR